MSLFPNSRYKVLYTQLTDSCIFNQQFIQIFRELNIPRKPHFKCCTAVFTETSAATTSATFRSSRCIIPLFRPRFNEGRGDRVSCFPSLYQSSCSSLLCPFRIKQRYTANSVAPVSAVPLPSRSDGRRGCNLGLMELYIRWRE